MVAFVLVYPDRKYSVAKCMSNRAAYNFARKLHNLPPQDRYVFIGAYRIVKYCPQDIEDYIDFVYSKQLPPYYEFLWWQSFPLYLDKEKKGEK